MGAAGSESARGDGPSAALRLAPWAGIALVVLLLRVPALLTEPWLDEMWSWDMAHRATSALEILWAVAFNHDNNHRLNTLWLYAVGPGAPPVLQRALAFACGLATVPLAGLLGARHSRCAALLSALFVGSSFLLVVYGTEARGYAPALALALAALALLHRALDRRAARGRVPAGTAAAFWGVCLLGFLAHLSFAHFYLGALLWSGVRLGRDAGGPGGRRRAARDLALLHAPLLGLLAFWGAARLVSMKVGGGPALPWGHTLDATLAWTFGYPLARVPPVVGLAAWLALVVAGLVQIARGPRDRDAWVLYGAVVLLAPALTLLLQQEGFFYPRYFLMPAAFSLLLGARLLAAASVRGRGGALLAAGLALCFVAGNARHAAEFARRGRYGTREAVAALARETPGTGPVRLTAEWPTWTLLALRYHAGLLGGRRVELRGPGRLKRLGAADLDWLVVQDAGPLPPAPPAARRLDGTRFVLRHAFGCYGPSCIHWLLYRRAPSPPGAAAPAP